MTMVTVLVPPKVLSKVLALVEAELKRAACGERKARIIEALRTDEIYLSIAAREGVSCSYVSQIAGLIGLLRKRAA